MNWRKLVSLGLFVPLLLLLPASAPHGAGGTAQAQPMEFRVHHVGIGVPDLDAAIEWYRDYLGFVEDRRFDIESVKAKAAFVRRGDFRVELFEFEGAGPLPAHRRDPVADLRYGGISHLAIEVDDVRAFFAELERKGVDVAVPVTEFMPGWPVAFIRDVAGNLIEIYRDPK